MIKLKVDKFNPLKSNSLFGHSQYFNILTNLYKQKKFPKVTLFSGEKGIGKFTLTLHLINSIYSENNQQYDYTNKIINIQNPFYKKILLNVNENFEYIGKNDHKKVSIDQVREIKKKLNASSFNDLPRFVIFDDADQLSSSSANALLKLIEEPSRLNHFILINNKRKKIIETLKSRSLEIKIFLSTKEKVSITKNLIKKFNVNLKDYNNFIPKTTPGTLIRVCDFLNEMEIDNSINFYNSISILIDKFKKDKEEICLEAIKFIVDFNIYKFSSNKNTNVLNMFFFKNKIIRTISDFENFNLSKKSLLDVFQGFPDHV